MKNVGIRSKLFFTTISILILAVSVSSTANIIRFRTMYKEALLERARSDADDMRKGIEQGLDFFPLESFSDMTLFLRSNLYEDFSYAYVASADQKVLYHTDPAETGKPLDETVYRGIFFPEGDGASIISISKYYEMVLPIEKDGKLIGTIHVGIENEIVDSRVRDMIIHNIFILFAAVLISVLALYILLTRNITGPIEGLVRKVKGINREFNLVIRKSDDGKGDEVQEFAAMFDTMAEELRKKTVSLQQDIEMRKKVEAELKRSNDELRITFEGSLRALSTAIESRDPYTAGHQQRVADLACAIAREMEIPETRIREIYLSAMSHDIGKIGIPIEYLTKEGKLTEEEYSLIKSHPQLGYDILKKIEFPWPIADIVRQHHERMDGSGYPLGLKGEEILKEARIIAVADVVEAIMSSRPYRKALGSNIALQEISQFREKKYDQEAVDACLKLFHEKKYKFDVEQGISQ